MTDLLKKGYDTVNLPSKTEGGTSAYNLQKVSFDSVQQSLIWSNANLQISFVETITASGSSAVNAPNFLSLNTGAASTSGVSYRTKRPISQVIAKGISLRTTLKFTGGGVSGNTREIGLYNPISQNGWLLRLDGATLKFLVLSAGVATIDIDSTNWDFPVTPDGNFHLVEIQTKSGSSGDFNVFIDRELKHTVSSLGTSASQFTQSNNNQLYVNNTNDTNTSDVGFEVGPVTIFDEGNQRTIVTDGTRDVLINTARRLNMQNYGNTLMQEKFSTTLDIVNRWLPTTVGGGNYTQPANTYTLKLETTTAINDSVELLFRVDGLEETTGDYASFEIGAKFGASLVTGNVREWGYKDSAGLNGLYFRIDGSDFNFVVLKGGVETLTSLAGSLPNANFHLYKIEHLGSGKIGGFIDNAQVVDFASAADSQVGSAEKKPFMKMYNTQALASTPSTSDFHWIRLVDLNDSTIAISGVDDNNISRRVSVSTAGRLLVETQPPEQPPNTFPVPLANRSGRGSVSGTPQDTIFTITNNRQLTIQSFLAGAESSNGGSKVELFEDPNGDLSVLNDIGVAYLNGSNYNATQNQTFTGDGTRRIVLRRSMTGGGSAEVFGQWLGFEVDI